MNRESIPVTLTSPSGDVYKLGNVSRVTTSCLVAYLEREGFERMREHNAPGGGTWERRATASPSQKRVAYTCQEWIVAVEKEVNAQ